jgi:phosphoribosylanthranilate isomerase
MTRIKITGITTAEDAQLAAASGVDMVGIIFFAQSPRYVTTEQAWAIRDALPSTIHLVGVFVDTPTPLVQRVIDHCRLDSAQLFGAEPRSAVESIRPHAFKAVTAETMEDLAAASRSYLGRRGPGGDQPALLLHLTGEMRAEWHAVAGAASRAQVLLAGDDLHAGTAAEAIASARPWGVDVWEAVESEPGHLDHARFAAFVDTVREADSQHAPPAG